MTTASCDGSRSPTWVPPLLSWVPEILHSEKGTLDFLSCLVWLGENSCASTERPSSCWGARGSRRNATAEKRKLVIRKGPEKLSREQWKQPRPPPSRVPKRLGAKPRSLKAFLLNYPCSRLLPLEQLLPGKAGFLKAKEFYLA